ncbi:MAG: hypothetical protein WCJ84_00455 [Candidatus Peregrinibacteria bacterium]
MLPTSLRVSPLLTDQSLGYNHNGFKFIGDKIFPTVLTNKRTGQIATYGAENLRIDTTPIAFNAPSPEVSMQVSIGAFFDIKDYRLKQLVTKKEIEEADLPIRPKTDAAWNLTGKFQVGLEKLIADAATNTSVITQNTTLSGTAKWSDSTSGASHPIKDVKTAVQLIKTNSGFTPNTMAIGWFALQELIVHPDILARFPGKDFVSYELLASQMGAIFGITNLIVGDAMYNSALKGAADTLAPIWNSSVFVGYVEQEPTEKSYSFGKCYRPRVTPTRQILEGQMQEDPEGQFIYAKEEFDLKVIEPKTAYVIAGVR